MSQQQDIIFIHGVGLDHTMWSGVMAQMDKRFNCLAIDMPGHAGLPSPEQPGLSGYVDGLASALGDVDGPVALVGFSMGALVAAQYTINHPDKVSRLVLMNAAHDRDADQRAAIRGRLETAEKEGPDALIDRAIARWFTKDFVAGHPDVVAAIRHRLEINDPTAFLAAYRVFATSDGELAPDISRITCPTLALTAANDANSTPVMSKAMARVIPNATAHVLEGLAHGAPIESPARVAAVLNPFLSNGDPS